MRRVSFKVQAVTDFGDTIVVCGDADALGSWSPESPAVHELTALSSYPLWRTETPVQLSRSIPIRYKYVRLKANGAVEWEEHMENRVLEAGGPQGDVVVDDGSFEDPSARRVHFPQAREERPRSKGDGKGKGDRRGKGDGKGSKGRRREGHGGHDAARGGAPPVDTVIRTPRPSYWSRETTALPWNPVSNLHDWETEFLLELLKFTGSLGGCDQKCKDPIGYTQMEVVGLWRVESIALWMKYAAKRWVIRQSIKDIAESSGVPLRKLETKISIKIPDVCGCDASINETFLLHGTDGHIIKSILTRNGFNERLASLRGMFGAALYFAEDPEKSDQYTMPRPLGEVVPAGSPAFGVGPEENVHFFLVCRVIFGDFLRAYNEHACEAGKDLYLGADKRELRQIEGSTDVHHGLVREIGGRIQRYREFMVYHGDQVYPEYLVAYKRTFG